jgi:hypothetical protein
MTGGPTIAGPFSLRGRLQMSDSDDWIVPGKNRRLVKPRGADRRVKFGKARRETFLGHLAATCFTAIRPRRSRPVRGAAHWRSDQAVVAAGADRCAIQPVLPKGE